MAEDNFLDRLKQGFKDRYSEGSEDYRQAYYAARELQGKDAEDVRIKSTFATNPTVVTARDLMLIQTHPTPVSYTHLTLPTILRV